VTAGRLCQLVHDDKRDHVVSIPVGVITTRGPILYADRTCPSMRDVDDDQIVNLSPMDEPYCPFCGGVMVESDDRTRLACVACSADVLFEGGRR
jgi:hypothetical protein